MNESTSTRDRAGTYLEFEDWFYELESYGTRAERFYDSITQFSMNATNENLSIWLRAAFEAGRSTASKI